MYIKKLELHGFKSFPDKTVLELTPGITVVVGPNGCGKSNVSDALRWVLGEQSARHLRGTRMDDIIFSGSSSRKPLGFAEVSVTLDNSDGELDMEYREVTVTRRLYRNGESEYLLNRRPCRLKDIQEIFLDTGVGKEAYSFIGQGRVDEILSARPEERRLIFEEAAGILKYKNRKREAERRLAETAENLLRINDIVHELSEQLQPLSLQAEDARHYLSLRDKLKELDVSLQVHDARQLRSQWYSLDEQYKKAADNLVEKQSRLARIEAELSGGQLKIDEEQARVAQMQQGLQQLAAEWEKEQGKIAVYAEKLSGLDRRINEVAATGLELAQKQEAVLLKREEVIKRQKETAALLEAAREQLGEAEAELKKVEQSPESLKALDCRAELEKMEPLLRKLQNEFDRITMSIEQLDERIGRNDTEIENLKQEQHELSQKESELKKRLADLNAEISALNRSENEVGLRKRESLSRRQELAAKQQDLSVQIMETRGRIRALTELEDSMTGYAQGVKSVMAMKKAGQAGIFGTVADILRVPGEYVAAVEAALGPALQYLVVSDENVAKNLINGLKRSGSGRATFLPLTLVRGRSQAAVPPEKIPGYIGPAVQLVSCDKEFRSVLEHLLARVHIVSNLEAAVPVARSLQFRERVVTLEGDIVQTGGAMTGGAYRHQTGILSRRKELKELEKINKNALEKLKGLEQEAEEADRVLHLAEKEAADLEKKKEQCRLALSLLENEIKYLDEQKQKISLHMKELSGRREQLAGEKEEAGQKLSAVQDELTAGRERERTLRYEIAGLAGMLEAREQEKKALQERCTEQKVRMASLSKQLEHCEEELERLEAELRELADKQRLGGEEVNRLKSEYLTLNDRLEETRESARELERQRGVLSAEFLQKEAAYKEMCTAHREESEALRRAEKELSALERKQNRLEMEKEKVELELRAVLERLRENWHMEFDEAEKTAGRLSDREKTVAEIAGLREEIQSLGTVNLGAVEEYERVNERVTFLTRQREDLLEAEKDLKRIITEIDSRMGEKFASTFTVINEQFDRCFKELFSGGRALLRLTDPENMLQTGIEIIAQPPGKKLQHLSLLSGGEKAMTAIALLFAFLKVRPAPFCVLDEIETALDETNLGRFCDYLKIMSEKIQFILISHRKRTMEQAGILYGITMEESGVSKVVSVRLKEAAPAAEAGS